ncbi:MAG: peptide chain release factor N(5)-glutamine methyltransferase [Candidatus Sulfotelmatobacter sp.]
MQLKQALASGVESLVAGQVPSPRMNAELLLRFVLNCDRAYLFAHPERELTAQEESHYQSALAERSRGVPAQYITGHQEFWGMNLIVTPAVLIPRPETEHVIENALQLLALEGPNFSQEETSDTGTAAGVSPIRIVDVGTGSGAIALALAKELPDAEIHATDISAAALEIARANAARHQLERRIHFQQADLLANLNPPFDLVVSNPPYVGESEEDQVQLEVRKFEPRTAVFAGATGTDVIARLVPQARAALQPGGWIVMEISGTIVDAARNLLEGWERIQVTNDLQAIPRVIRARKPIT